MDNWTRYIGMREQGRLESAGSPPVVPPDSFGGKRFYAYILPYTNVYASWMNGFDRYIKNLDSEYGTMRFYKLAYLYMCFCFFVGNMGACNPVKQDCNPGLQYTVYIGLFIIRKEYFGNKNS